MTPNIVDKLSTTQVLGLSSRSSCGCSSRRYRCGGSRRCSCWDYAFFATTMALGLTTAPSM